MPCVRSLGRCDDTQRGRLETSGSQEFVCTIEPDVYAESVQISRSRLGLMMMVMMGSEKYVDAE